MKTQKYNAKKTVVDGITFDSRKESTFYQGLLKEKESGYIKEITLQPVFVLQEGFKRGKRTIRPIKYKADFLVIYANGKREIFDVKGVRTPVYLLKKKLFEYKYPDLEIVEV